MDTTDQLRLLHIFKICTPPSAPMLNSPVPYGKNQKHIGVFGGSYQNLHTGTVFDAEQHGKSHSAKKWHGPLKKRVFLKKIWEKLR